VREDDPRVVDERHARPVWERRHPLREVELAARPHLEVVDDGHRRGLAGPRRHDVATVGRDGHGALLGGAVAQPRDGVVPEVVDPHPGEVLGIVLDEQALAVREPLGEPRLRPVDADVEPPGVRAVRARDVDVAVLQRLALVGDVGHALARRGEDAAPHRLVVRRHLLALAGRAVEAVEVHLCALVAPVQQDPAVRADVVEDGLAVDRHDRVHLAVARDLVDVVLLVAVLVPVEEDAVAVGSRQEVPAGVSRDGPVAPPRPLAGREVLDVEFVAPRLVVVVGDRLATRQDDRVVELRQPRQRLRVEVGGLRDLLGHTLNLAETSINTRLLLSSSAFAFPGWLGVCLPQWLYSPFGFSLPPPSASGDAFVGTRHTDSSRYKSRK
jgi:hypothetical protein